MHEDADYMRRENKYEQTLNRHFEAWQYQESLAKVRTISYHYFDEPEANIFTDRVWFADHIQLRGCIRPMCR